MTPLHSLRDSPMYTLASGGHKSKVDQHKVKYSFITEGLNCLHCLSSSWVDWTIHVQEKNKIKHKINIYYIKSI